MPATVHLAHVPLYHYPACDAAQVQSYVGDTLRTSGEYLILSPPSPGQPYDFITTVSACDCCRDVAQGMARFAIEELLAGNGAGRRMACSEGWAERTGFALPGRHHVVRRDGTIFVEDH